MSWHKTPKTRAGESGSEGVSPNRHSLGCPAAVHSAAGKDISSHLEEIRMENICVKNKRIKIAIQRKSKLCLLHNKYKPCPGHLWSLLQEQCAGSPGGCSAAGRVTPEGASSPRQGRGLHKLVVQLEGENQLSPDG